MRRDSLGLVELFSKTFPYSPAGEGNTKPACLLYTVESKVYNGNSPVCTVQLTLPGVKQQKTGEKPSVKLCTTVMHSIFLREHVAGSDKAGSWFIISVV